MNIKQAAEQSGVSARNIRYYEQAGLLTLPATLKNEYRIYSQADVRALKLIRMLRTLDMPVEEIGTVLNGTLPLAEAAERQRQRLEAEQQSWRQPQPSARSWPPATERRQSWMWTAALSGWTPPCPGGRLVYRLGCRTTGKWRLPSISGSLPLRRTPPLQPPQEFTAELLAWAANCGEGDRHHPREHGAAVYAGRHRVQGRAVFESCAQYPDPAGSVRGVRSIGAGGGGRPESGCGCRDFCTTACRCLYALHWQWSGSAPGICRFGPTRRLCCWCWRSRHRVRLPRGGISITTTETNKKNGRQRGLSPI